MSSEEAKKEGDRLMAILAVFYNILGKAVAKRQSELKEGRWVAPVLQSIISEGLIGSSVETLFVIGAAVLTNMTQDEARLVHPYVPDDEMATLMISLQVTAGRILEKHGYSLDDKAAEVAMSTVGTATIN